MGIRKVVVVFAASVLAVLMTFGITHVGVSAATYEVLSNSKMTLRERVVEGHILKDVFSTFYCGTMGIKNRAFKDDYVKYEGDASSGVTTEIIMTRPDEISHTNHFEVDGIGSVTIDLGTGNIGVSVSIGSGFASATYGVEDNYYNIKIKYTSTVYRNTIWTYEQKAVGRVVYGNEIAELDSTSEQYRVNYSKTKISN